MRASARARQLGVERACSYLPSKPQALLFVGSGPKRQETLFRIFLGLVGIGTATVRLAVHAKSIWVCTWTLGAP